MVTLQDLLDTQLSGYGADEDFKDRDWNLVANALKDGRDVAGGVKTLAALLPQVIKGEVKLDGGELLSAFGEGLKEQYGQQNGLDVANLVKSFYYHPSNILDIMPVLKAAGLTKQIGSAVGKVGSAAKGIAKGVNIASSVEKALPDNVLAMLGKGTKQLQLSGMDDLLELAQPAKKAAEAASTVSKSGMIKKLTGQFKRAVLGLNPSWMVGNTTGNLFNSVMSGAVDPKDYIQAFKQAFKGTLPDEITRTGFHHTDDMVARSNNPILKTFTGAVDKGYEFNTKLEDSVRAANYAFQLKKTGGDQAKALNNMLKSMGNYAEDNGNFGLLAPFYKFYREQAKVTGKQIVERPIVTGAIRHAGNEGANLADIQEKLLSDIGFDVKDYQKYGAVSGQDEQGNPIMTSNQNLLPFLPLGDMAGKLGEGDIAGMGSYLSPLLGMYRKIIGGQNFHGGAISSPNVVSTYNGRYEVDSETGEVKPLGDTEYPNQDVLPLVLSELIRNFIPAAGLAERALPYSSYDTMYGVPNVNARPKVDDYWTSLLGVGSRSRVSKRQNLTIKEIKKMMEQKEAQRLGGSQDGNI